MTDLPYNPLALLYRKASKMRAKRIAKRSTKRSPTKNRTPWGWKFPDGREVCNLATTAGKREYAERRELMAVRQNCLCCFCGQYMWTWEVTFEHANGRGGGKRDDRILDANGQPMNKAAHGTCNGQAGSPKRVKKAGA